MDFEKYLNHLTQDYSDWLELYHSNNPEFVSKRKEDFKTNLSVVEGKTYYKVVSNGSAHSFICKADNGKFKRGDILKANSWTAPAKNFLRGNILIDDFKHISWTGA